MLTPHELSNHNRAKGLRASELSLEKADAPFLCNLEQLTHSAPLSLCARV